MLPPVPIALVECAAEVRMVAPGEELVILSDELRNEYESHFHALIVKPEKLDEANKIIERIVRGRAQYEQVAATYAVPWYVVAVIHQMECDGNFHCHLYNGDPLDRRTVKAPPGRPLTGTPPFTWDFAAVDALRYEREVGSWRGITPETWKAWGIAETLLKIELYNGWGYRQRNVPAPYVYAGTQFYRTGKFIEIKVNGKWKAVFRSALVSDQIGAAALLRLMNDRGLFAFSDQLGPAIQCETK